VNANNDATGRNVAEVLRALEATQNPGLTGCDWTPGDATL
jgi:peroxiredoxin (alkyl hydroperoxide reductase subunit C)